MVAVALALVAAGCGGDEEGVPSGPASSSEVEQDSSAPGHDSGSSVEEAACSPVGEDLAASASETVEIELGDYAFGPAMVEVGAGVVSFAAQNIGTENHELAFLPGGGEVPLNDQGEPDEDALASAGAFELEAFGPGMTCDATYELEAGTYTLFCIVTSADGETHYDKGMRGQLVVS